MRKGLSIFFFLLMIGTLGVAIYLGMQAYMVVQVDGDILRDGLGRAIYEPPAWLMIFRVDEWRGMFWSSVDTILGFVALGLIFLFCKLFLHFKEEA